MQLVKNIDLLKKQIRKIKLSKKTIGFVPTMGYLHDGHLSLIKQASKECDIVVVSIFVNPTQFGPNEDLSRYPRDLKRDLNLLRKENTDIVFIPNTAIMYPDGFKTYVNVEGLGEVLCGVSRPSHFKGVATVVAKLFNLVEPDAAYFGQKDAQQAIIINKMVEDLNMNVNVKVLPIVREKDGLAISSRNIYLNPKNRSNAVILYKSLKCAKQVINKGVRN
ncbi:MAG: pantoate--beta-alanine ligase, partial [Candidatus Omnitrophica bacterium]|nr:pantoate--beta-alanine ligase [Candidatus Omnitrophota bacterium]